MHPLRSWLFRLRALFRRKGLEEELSEEIRLHLEMQVEANLAAGMAPDEALNAAQRDFGGIDQVKERYRDERGIRWIDDGARDLLHSIRSLARDRAFTATVLATFSFCVAANVAIFTVVHQILLRPLPFPDPEGILAISDSYPKAGVIGGVSVPHFLERREQVGAFAEAAATREDWVQLEARGSTESVRVLYSTASFLPLLRTRVALGRTFTPEDETEGHGRVAILSDEIWRRRYNADPAAVGQTMRVDNVAYTIIGVMPSGFRYLSARPSLWLPLIFTPYERLDGMRHANGLSMIVRLREGTPLAEAQSQLNEVNTRTLKQDPYAVLVTQGGFCSVIHGLHADYVARIQPTLLLIQAGALFLLLIGAVNGANLFLVRSTARAREYGIRRALGAGSYRIARSLVLETLLLAVFGGVAGLAAGAAVLRLSLATFSDRLPMEIAATPNPAVCAVTLAACVLLGLVLALPGVWQITRGDLTSAPRLSDQNPLISS